MELPAVLARAVQHAGRTAIRDVHGSHTYAALLSRANELASTLLQRDFPVFDKRAPRIAFLTPRDHTYQISQWAAYSAGAIAVPLAENHPQPELEYVLNDAAVSAVIATPATLPRIEAAAKATGKTIHLLEPLAPAASSSAAAAAAAAPASAAAADAEAETVAALQAKIAGLQRSLHMHIAWPRSDAMLIYTSGTTGRPKGVLTTHAALEAQITAMTTAWGWRATDAIYGVLPLHHVHGVVAVMACAHWAGATVEMAPKFDAAATWAALTRPASAPDALSLFMAVPTVYMRLLQHYDAQRPDTQAAWREVLHTPGASAVRLMVSGSAALPQSIAERWTAVTGHRLLERYGMTEFAMAISNPLAPAEARRLNSVGVPLPGYQVRFAAEGADAAADGTAVVEHGPGELQVRGPGVFAEYWGKPEATAETFTPDGWFKTGDRAVRDPDSGFISIQGRLSADIIKSNAYKISALDIERELLEHPAIEEVAVLGVPHEAQGEAVAAVLMLKPGGSGAVAPVAADADADAAALAAFASDLQAWCKPRMPVYRIPSIIRVVKEIPRNAMGKVNKKELRAAMFGTGAPAK